MFPVMFLAMGLLPLLLEFLLNWYVMNLAVVTPTLLGAAASLAGCALGRRGGSGNG